MTARRGQKPGEKSYDVLPREERRAGHTLEEAVTGPGHELSSRVSVLARETSRKLALPFLYPRLRPPNETSLSTVSSTTLLILLLILILLLLRAALSRSLLIRPPFSPISPDFSRHRLLSSLATAWLSSLWWLRKRLFDFFQYRKIAATKHRSNVDIRRKDRWKI